jgi:hypothetical protein
MADGPEGIVLGGENEWRDDLHSKVEKTYRLLQAVANTTLQISATVQELSRQAGDTTKLSNAISDLKVKTDALQAAINSAPHS